MGKKQIASLIQTARVMTLTMPTGQGLQRAFSLAQGAMVSSCSAEVSGMREKSVPVRNTMDSL